MIIITVELENILRAKYNPELEYLGSFIVHHIEKLVCPDVNPLMILIPTIIIAIFTIVIFIINNKEPHKTVYSSLKDASLRLGLDYKKLRPYLQDFSLGKNTD